LFDYCVSLIMPGERKSIEPMAAVTAPDRAAAQHQSLLHFVGQSPWSDEGVLNKRYFSHTPFNMSIPYLIPELNAVGADGLLTAIYQFPSSAMLANPPVSVCAGFGLYRIA
jgi:hypothetical protein